MNNRAELAAAMPAMLLHEGHWDGMYRHFDGDGGLLDAHRVKTWCEFPDAGEWHYVQHNQLIWDDGRTANYEFGGRLDHDGIVDRLNVTPRVGTAVLLNESGGAVLRGGFGLFFERTPSTVGAFRQFESAIDARFAADGP